jgi:hypothetical protein
MYFAVHQEGAADTSWGTSRTAIQGPNYADDHINLKSLQADASGRVFAAVKTSLNDLPNGSLNAPLVMLLVRDPATGAWSSSVFGTVGNDHTRPIVMLDETPVSLSVSGLPSNSTGSFSPNPVSVPSSLSSTLSVATNSATKNGGFTLTITGTGAGLTHSVAVNLQVRKR